MYNRIIFAVGYFVHKHDMKKLYNSFLVYCRELAPGTVSLTGDRAQGDDSKHDSHYTCKLERKELVVIRLVAHWGTPLITMMLSKIAPSTCTCWALTVRKARRHKYVSLNRIWMVSQTFYDSQYLFQQELLVKVNTCLFYFNKCTLRYFHSASACFYRPNIYAMWETSTLCKWKTLHLLILHPCVCTMYWQ